MDTDRLETAKKISENIEDCRSDLDYWIGCKKSNIQYWHWFSDHIFDEFKRNVIEDLVCKKRQLETELENL